MICPSCGSRQVGYLPGSQYYCWSCFVQFVVGDNTTDVFEVTEDGTLVPLDPAEFGVASSAPGR